MNSPEIWVPGKNLEHEYPVPSDVELVELWNGYSVSENSVALSGIYGVMTPPPTEVTAVASIDLCEVVRETVSSFHEAITSIKNIPKNCIYSENTWLEKVKHFNQSDFVTDVVRVLMSHGKIAPVDGIEEIGDILRQLRGHGVLVLANTSTLPGCEKGTIEHTLGRDLPGCFDGLILPRNHDGLGPITKAGALKIATSELGIDLYDKPVLHIDDAPHHIKAFTNEFADHNTLRLFVPEYEHNLSMSDDKRYASPLDAFRGAKEFLESEGVLA